MNVRGNTKDVHRLLDIVVEEVSLVDRAANKQRFLIVKRSDKMNDTTENTTNDAVANDIGVSNGDTTTNPSVTGATYDADSSAADSPQAPENNETSLQQMAVTALSVLTDVVEHLGNSKDENTGSRIVELAGDLRSVAERLSETSDSSVSSDKEANQQTDSQSKQIDSLITSVRAALQQMSALALRKANEKQTEVPSNEDKLSKLIEELRKLTTTVKEQQQRLSKVEKRFGLPSSVPVGEGRVRQENEEIGWPLDMNHSCDRESVDKAVSFHDV